METSALCDKMDELAVRTWRTLVRARQLRVPRGEVTITEDLLLELMDHERQRGLGFDLRVVPTTQVTERRTGADFEIWLQVGQRKYFPYSIQAKKAVVTERTGSYDALGHRAHASTLSKRNAHSSAPFQYDTLIEHAKLIQTIPMHLFYNGWETPPPGVELPNPPADEYYGCAVLPTGTVKQIREARTRSVHRIKEYAPRQRPWSTLFRRPPTGRAGSGLGRPLDTASFQAVQEFGMVLGLDVLDREDGLPPYVSQGLEASQDDDVEIPNDPTLPRFAVVVRDPKIYITGRGRVASKPE